MNKTLRRVMSGENLEWRTGKTGRTLHLNGKGPALCRMVPDPTGLWRVEQDGRLSDIVNISRASDAAISLALAKLNRPEERAANRPPIDLLQAG
jgi:hypothetical protein